MMPCCCTWGGAGKAGSQRRGLGKFIAVLSSLILAWQGSWGKLSMQRCPDWTAPPELAAQLLVPAWLNMHPRWN